MKHVVILLIGGVAFLASYFVPETGMLICDIIIKSGILTILFCVMIYFSKVSEDVTDLVEEFRQKLGGKSRK